MSNAQADWNTGNSRRDFQRVGVRDLVSLKLPKHTHKHTQIKHVHSNTRIGTVHAKITDSITLTHTYLQLWHNKGAVAVRTNTLKSLNPKCQGSKRPQLSCVHRTL